MSKIATYLNEHLTGEVATSGVEITDASTDGGVLLQKPEMVAHTANTSDIRKIARFCWQLAEKGHVLPVVVRGQGTDSTSGAIGSGVVISPEKYMNRVIGIDQKQRLIHVQSGASCSGVNMTLSTHRGMTLPYDAFGPGIGTVGGAIASGSVGLMSQRYGTFGSAVQQLEVVLANGDVLQTGKLTKRELNAKKGLHTMEGEIYRNIDNLLSDNEELIKSLRSNPGHDAGGYSSIAHVKNKDGSIDLTPLFVGSQGSLGIITEVIMQARFERKELTFVLAAYSDAGDAQAAADIAVETKGVVSVEIIDGRVLARAAKQGKKRDFAPAECFKKGALVVVIYDEFNERNREKSAKKLIKQLEKTSGVVHTSMNSLASSEIAEIYAPLSVASSPSVAGQVVPGVFSGIWLPKVRIDSFWTKLRKLEKTYGIDLPLYIDVKNGFVDLLPVFDMKKVSDRQKLLKILAELAVIVQESEGSLSGRGGDGRLKSLVSQKVAGDDVLKLYEEVKQIFDPHNIFNPGVKQSMASKDVVSQLNAWCRQLK